eukprot:4019945-Pyramimonas_sp.AAC.1
MEAIAEMRGSYPVLQSGGEAVPPIPTDLSNRRSGPLHLSLRICTLRSATNELTACRSHEGSFHTRRRLSTHCSDILSKALFWSQKMTAVPGALPSAVAA